MFCPMAYQAEQLVNFAIVSFQAKIRPSSRSPTTINSARSIARRGKWQMVTGTLVSSFFICYSAVMELLGNVLRLLFVLVVLVEVVGATIAAGATNTNSPLLSIPVLPSHLFCRAIDQDDTAAAAGGGNNEGQVYTRSDCFTCAAVCYDAIFTYP